jgi:hypothetical protein
MHQYVEYMQEMTMLTPCLLTELHDFSVYSLQELRLEYWIFSRVKWEIIYQVPKVVPPRASKGPEEGMGQDLGPVGLVGDRPAPPYGRPAPLFYRISSNLVAT